MTLAISTLISFILGSFFGLGLILFIQKKNKQKHQEEATQLNQTFQEISEQIVQKKTHNRFSNSQKKNSVMKVSFKANFRQKN